MSQHPSLQIDSVGAKHRNVLKRYERVKILKGQGRWNERPSVLGLPKVKSLKIKVKKVKAAPVEGEKAAGATAAAVPSADKPAVTKPAAAKPAAKPAAGGAK